MLDQRQIKKMARAYTDKQIAGKTNRVLVDENAWSNGEIVILGDLPKTLKDDHCVNECSTGDPRIYNRIVEWWTGETVPCWPVFVGQVTYSSRADCNEPMVQFQNHTTSAFCNGRYVSAMLRRVKTAKMKKLVSWSMGKLDDHVLGSLLFLEVDGSPVAALAMLTKIYDDPDDVDAWDWSLTNKDVPV